MDISGIASLISSGSGIASNLSSMFGGGGASDQSAMSKQLLKLMTAGIDDGNGNTVVYDKHTNTFKTVLNPSNQQAAKASDMETLQRLLTEMPRERQERYQNSLGRGQDRSLADTLRGQITSANKNRMTPQRLEGDLYSANSRGISDAYGKVRNDVATTGLRTHTSGDSAIKNLAKAMAGQMGDARTSAKLSGIQGADQVNQGHIGELMNEYGAENASANNIDNVPFNPFTLNTQMAQLAASQKSQVPYASAVGASIGSKANSDFSDNIFNGGQNLAILLNSFKKPLDLGGGGGTTSTGLGNKNYVSGQMGHI